MLGYPGLSLQAYLGNNKVSELVAENAVDLLNRVEGLLWDLGWNDDVHISSGYRNPEHNKSVGGKPKSWHMLGRAVDLKDKTGELYELITARSPLLEEHGLWLESGTVGWVHLDTGIRKARKVRIFLP